MYCILMDLATKTYFMKPREMKFCAYSSPSKRNSAESGATSVLVETTITDRKELTTKMYNAGFSEGYIDGAPVRLTKEDAYFLDRNRNEICYAQYLLTGDERYLKSIEKEKLFSLCKIVPEGAVFPTVEENGTSTVLCYTDRQRIPQILFDKYSDGYRVVRMSFSVPVFVNSRFYLD